MKIFAVIYDFQPIVCWPNSQKINFSSPTKIIDFLSRISLFGSYIAVWDALEI